MGMPRDLHLVFVSGPDNYLGIDFRDKKTLKVTIYTMIYLYDCMDIKTNEVPIMLCRLQVLISR